MPAIPVIAIFDIGKSNKKCLLFNRQYQVVAEYSTQLAEVMDDDGFPCEDLQALSAWVLETFHTITSSENYDVKAVNCTAYGASLVHLDAKDRVVAPLYNYLKPFPAVMEEAVQRCMRNENGFMEATAAPFMGFLNSGWQLLWLKGQKPESFAQVSYSLHLPQYIAYLLHGQKFSEITSLGCHTALWDFQQQVYHAWVLEEQLERLLPPIISSRHVMQTTVLQNSIPVGVGLHDSSAALIPYLEVFKEPFVLLSTGTWNISLNPFNARSLTAADIKNNCTGYLGYEGRTVVASRFFAGYIHEQSAAAIASHFHQDPLFYTSMDYNPSLHGQWKAAAARFAATIAATTLTEAHHNIFSKYPLSHFSSAAAAYHFLMLYLVTQQKRSTEAVLEKSDVKIFVDGGFSNNRIFMQLLADAFPANDVYAASMPQATALGAALVLHTQWNAGALPEDLVCLRPVRL